MMRECVERNVVRVDNMEPGEFRPVYKTDPGGTKTVEWHGPQSFVVGLSQTPFGIRHSLFARWIASSLTFRNGVLLRRRGQRTHAAGYASLHAARDSPRNMPARRRANSANVVGLTPNASWVPR
jgi:hypothetical protein